MTKWIRAMTDIGMTRIRMDAICAYQSIDNDGGDSKPLLIYTSDNTLFEIIENIDELVGVLDSAFEFHN
tara:strand:- start:1806 stop:2012 length:207 start_codon:yes stop_codon:yes gene_type:complete